MPNLQRYPTLDHPVADGAKATGAEWLATRRGTFRDTASRQSLSAYQVKVIERP